MKRTPTIPDFKPCLSISRFCRCKKSSNAINTTLSLSSDIQEASTFFENAPAARNYMWFLLILIHGDSTSALNAAVSGFVTRTRQRSTVRPIKNTNTSFVVC